MSEGNLAIGLNNYMNTNQNDVFDFQMPEIPEPVQEAFKEFKDKDNVGFKFGFIGAGQGGGKLAEAFSQIGYARVGALNTADQDLETVNVPVKFKFGKQQGAGKDRGVAKSAFSQQKEDVIDFIKQSVGTDIDRIFVTVGAGGGTGAGVCSELIKVVKEYQETVKATSPYVGVILALPKVSEGKKVSLNAYETLKEVCQLVDQKIVSPLIILDNEKINVLYPKLPVSKFWQVANLRAANILVLILMILEQF
jgi:cell division GTPase FtsZ